MGSNKLKQIIDSVSKYVENRGFSNRPSPGLLEPKFNYPFSPSAGHHVIDDVVVSDTNPRPVFKFSVIPDRSLRMYDVDKIGISDRHLSVFETLLIGYAGNEKELPKKESCIELFNVFKHFKLDPDKLLVTCLGYAEAEGRKFDLSNGDEFYDSWKEILGKDKVKKTRGRRNLLYASVIGNPGGTGCELYYNIN